MDSKQIKRFLEGAVIGGVVLATALFGTGWAVKSSTAERTAHEQTQTAVVDSLAAICVAQFDMASNKTTKLAEMASVESWKRGKFVSDQGWATMPGSDTALGIVANECARRLANRKS